MPENAECGVIPDKMRPVFISRTAKFSALERIEEAKWNLIDPNRCVTLKASSQA